MKSKRDRGRGWPYGDLDGEALQLDGWRPIPFREFVLKVHQRCNLACDYCYVYELADQSWRDRPTLMPSRVRTMAVERIAEHVRTHRLKRIKVILHGGEPLLAGPHRLARLVAEARRAIPGSCTVSFDLQTNGVLLTEPTLDILGAAGIRVGVSVDGGAADHDRHRRHRNGRGSFAEVRTALRHLGTPRYRPLFSGLLCTVDLANDPVATYEALLEFEPPTIDLLLPHANWIAPPPGGPISYADWLIAVFDRYCDAPRAETSIRLFDEAISLVLGGSSRTEQLGLSPAGLIVVESDGEIEQVDALKSAYPGACATGLNVLFDPFDAALGHPGVMARQIGVAALSDTCRQCPVHEVCGGGHYAHRYRPGTGFRNPSVYCADLQTFVRHVQARVAADLALRSEAG